MTDSGFLGGVIRLIVFGVIQVPVMILLSLLAALAFDLGQGRVNGLFRTVLFLPYAVPAVVAALMWSYLLEPTFGPADVVSRAVGLGTPNLFGSGTVLVVLGVIVTWESVGVNMVILYTALRAVPRELTEAAVLDGAGLFRVIRYIRVPMIGTAVAMVTVLSIIGTLQLFTEPEILSRLGAAITTTYTPNLAIYNTAFTEELLGQAAAMSFMLGLFTVCLVGLALVFRRILSKRAGVMA